MKRLFRILRVTHFRTPANVKVGVAVVSLVILPALISVTLRVVELGSRVEMYF